MKTLLTHSNRRSGFSIIELLVAIIIIGILVTILLPVVANRAEQARVARVNSDLENLASSMERVAVDTGYYVRLFALNDVLRGDGVAFNRDLPGDPDDNIDGLTDYDIGGGFLEFPGSNSLFIDTRTGDFAVGLNRTAFFNRLLATETNFDGTSVGWTGPYINWQTDDNIYQGVAGRTGVPDDPWGNDYILFTREGMFLEPDGLLVDSVSQNVDGGFSSGGPFDTFEIFDRPTIISLGPNGAPGDGSTTGDEGDFGEADDFVRQFGR